MARAVLGDELEHIDLDTAAPAPTRERRPWPRRRIVVLAVTVALIAGLLGPVRTQALERGFRHLEAIFLESQALSAARADDYAAVFRRAAVHDQARLTLAADHLYEAEEDTQAALQRRLDDEWRVGLDGGLRRLRDALERVVMRDPPYADLARARALLTSTRRRLGLDPQRRPTVSLRSAVADDLRALTRYFDGATRTRLVVATNAGLYEIDIDVSRTRRLDPVGFESTEGTTLFVRDGWILARKGGGLSFALSADMQRATFLGDAAWPAARPDTVWVSDGPMWWDLTEVDSTGAPVRGPFGISPSNDQLVAVADGGFVLQETDGDAIFRIWDPDRRRTRSRHAGWPLAVHGDLVLRLVATQEGEQAEVVDVRTGRVVTQVTPGVGIGTATFSPDGRRLAFAGAEGARVVDVPSGRARDVPGDLIPDGSGVARSPSGEFVFFYAGSVIVAWEVDGGTPTVLRVSADLGYQVTGLVALPA